MPLCDVTLQFLPLECGVYFPTAWIWDSLMTSFSQEDEMEAMCCWFQVRTLKGFAHFCLLSWNSCEQAQVRLQEDESAYGAEMNHPRWGLKDVLST